MRALVILGILILGSSMPCLAETSVDRDARMAWWREARFGMFVHWGLYSGLGGTWEGEPAPRDRNLEHLQRVVGADTYTYAAHAIPKFRPKKDFAKVWARLAKQAGCRYVVFTTKHHEGFALHDSALTQFDAGDVVGRDLVHEISQSLRAEGLRVGFYHSLIDWHHPQYDFTRAKFPPYPENGKGMTAGPRHHDRYVDFLHGQVRELLTRYGKVDILWWDYSSISFDGDEAWRASDLISMCHALQPGIVMNNRLFRRPEAGFSMDGGADLSRPLDPKLGDFGTPEQHVPDVRPAMDWETCMTLNHTWGYSEHDHDWKSATTIIRNLAEIVGKGGNYLLNIGPTGDGSIPQASVDIMEAVGKWMEVNDESIYGTNAGPFETLSFEGACTGKDEALYLHVFRRPESGVIELPVGGREAVLLDGGKKLVTSRRGELLVIEVPAELPDAAVTVIRVR